MAATLQPQQQANPQLKRLVYSKYREMLGSYNDKANTIIQSLPSYMVTEDRGFQFEEKDDCDKVGYGGQRLQANPGVEPPVCVQNAMMTKDKKPFTYTPGGIDLSEIKSPRMAKRIARNAQHEGVSGQPKPSPLAQQNATQQSPPIAPQPPSALGMPVQVFPTGPPPPPPQSSQNKAAPPPPPPQPSANQLKPQSNGIDTRRSPTPQNFEPPPMGCRPEIKIPPNPMATLRKVPKPKEKNDFWIDEYRRDRSSSPMIASNDQVDEAQNHQNYSTKPQDQVYTPAPIQPSFRSVSPPKQQYRPPSPIQPQYQEPPRVQPQLAFPIQQGLQTRVEPPYASPSSPIQSVPSPPRSNHPPSNRWGPPPQPQQQQQQQQTKNVQVGSLYIPPVAPENLATTKQQDQQQRSAAVTNSPTPKWMAQRPNMKEVPEWVRDEEDSARSSPPQRTQQVMHSPPHTVSPPTTAPFMSFQIATTAPNAKERVIPIQMEQPGTPVKTPGTPNYGPQPFYNTNQQFSSVPSPNSAGSGHANSSSGYNSPTHVIRNPNQFVDQGYNNYQWPAQNRVKSPPVQQHPTATETTGVTRIIPIAIEGQDNSFPPNVVRGPISQSPMVIQNNPYSSDPRTLQHQNSWGASTPNQSKSFRILQKITDTEANQDSELDSSSQIQRPLYSRQLGGTPSVDSSIDQMKRMQLNEQDRDFMNRVKTSVDQEIFLHNEEDPRYRGGAIPSKSFKLLQNMVNINSGDPQYNQVPMQRPQLPRYVQQKSIIQQGENIQPYIHPSEQQVPEPKKYMGSAIPSRSFKILQAMTTPENAAEMEGSSVECEQISPNNFYPPYPYLIPYPMPPYYFHPVDPNWHYPYPPPIPCFYYYPEYDSQNGQEHFRHTAPSSKEAVICNNKQKKLRTPNIIVTPTPEDEEEYVKDLSADQGQLKNEESPLDLLSKKLNQIIVKPELDMNISKDDKKYVGDGNKDLMDSSSPINNEQPIEAETTLKTGEHSDDDLFSSSSSSGFANAKRIKCLSTSDSKEGLQAIKSVTDIKVYDICNDVQDVETSPLNDTENVDDSEDDTSTATSDTSSTADAEDSEEDETDSDECEELTEDEVVVPEALSIIYEESEGDAANRIRHESQCSTGSTLSDCSTTIANDYSDNEEDAEEMKEISMVDIDSLVTTVRLPLKVSFSRSSNDENITTVEVGDSEIEDEKSVSQSKQLCESGDSDVSVTFKLSRKRSSSVEPCAGVSASTSTDRISWTGECDRSDSDVSISFSLPMKKDKFVAQTISAGALVNNISKIHSESSCELNEKIYSDSLKESLEQTKPITWIMGSTKPIDDNEECSDLNLPNIEAKVSLSPSTQNKSKWEDFSETWDWDSFPAISEEKMLSSKVVQATLQNKVENIKNDKIEKELNEPNHYESGEDIKEQEELKMDNVKEEETSNIFNIKHKKDEITNNEYDEESEEEEIVEEIYYEEEDEEEEVETEAESEEVEHNSESDEKDESEEEVSGEEEQSESNVSNSLNDADNLTPTNVYPNLMKQDDILFKSTSPFDFLEKKVCTDDASEAEVIKVSVKDRIAVFEAVASEPSLSEPNKLQVFTEITTNNPSDMKKSLSRNNSSLKSESELEEDDSGVTDMGKAISETDTESECFPELRKMTRYQRAATHSRLFKLLQNEASFDEASEDQLEETKPTFHSRKKIVHNVSITRKTNPEAVKNAETMTQRRERLSLSLHKTNSIDADNLSSSNSPSSPTGTSTVSDKLVNELVQSLLLKKKSRYLRNLPMEKLQEAAKRVLKEDMDSLEDTSIESTPALTPQEFKNETPNSYSDYYESWNVKSVESNENDYDILPSKAFKTLQEQSLSGRRKPWAARCPRVLSSKKVNSDLARVTESPETYRSASVTRSTPEKHPDFVRGCSLSKLGI